LRLVHNFFIGFKFGEDEDDGRSNRCPVSFVH